MKKVKFICLLSILFGAHTLVNGQVVSKCFRADWLQGERIVEFTINGKRVSGTFTVKGGSIAETGIYNFSGTLNGNALNVNFAENNLPDVSPSVMKSLVWRLVPVRGKESLQIKFYGKNYQTNKLEDSIADFESCNAKQGEAKPRFTELTDQKSDYAALAKTAQTVRFKKGASSAKISLVPFTQFQTMEAHAVFSLYAAKSQSLEVKAVGCVIEIYLPDKKLYEYVEWEGEGEKTYANSQIDTMSIKALPLNGNYLIVLRKPVENMRPEMLTVTVTR